MSGPRFLPEREKNGKPPTFILEMGLIIPTNIGDTPLHYAAHYGYLNEIPVELLTNQNLATRNHSNSTPMHDAAFNGFAGVPKTAFTEAMLMMRETNGRTPLFYACEAELLDSLLGIEFSPAIIIEVGEEWFEKNQQVVKQKAKLIPEENKSEVIEIF